MVCCSTMEHCIFPFSFLLLLYILLCFSYVFSFVLDRMLFYDGTVSIQGIKKDCNRQDVVLRWCISTVGK